MPNLTPEQRAEAIDTFRKIANIHRALALEYDSHPEEKELEEQQHATYAAAADALEALPELAEHNRLMREALEWAKDHVESAADQDAYDDNPTGAPTVALNLLEAALALTPTEAEAQAKGNAEKAALLDWLFTEIDGWGRTNLLACQMRWNGEDSFLDFCRSVIDAEKEADRG